MTIDASIYGMIKPQQAGPGPMEQYAQIAQVRGLMDVNDLNAMKKSEMERSIASQGRMRDLFSRGNVKPEEVMAIDPATGMQYAKDQRDAQKSDAELKAKNMEMLAKATGILKDRLPTVRDEASFQAYKEGALQLLGPDMVGKLNLPQTFDPIWVRNQSVEAKELFTPKPTQVKMPDGSIQTVDMNPFTNPQAVNFKAAPGMTPAEQATRDNQRASLRETQRHHQVTEGQPVWDSERGVFVPRPGAGTAVAAPATVTAATPATTPAVAPGAQPAASPAAAAPAGAAIPVPGLPPRASDSKLTEAQGNASAFGMRAAESHRILQGLEDEGITDTGVVRSVVSGAAGMVPFLGDKLDNAVSSAMNTLPEFAGGPSSKQQQTEQARRDFVNAVLRKESGAVISREEFENASRQYFPQPGDSKETIAQKRANRDMAIKALSVQAGSGAKNIPASVSGQSVSGKIQGVDPSKLSDDELRRELGL